MNERPAAATKRKHARHRYPSVRKLDASVPVRRVKGDPTKIDLRRVEQLRPRTRADCIPARSALVAHLDDDEPLKRLAPCPWVACRYHLHVDRERATQAGSAGTTLHIHADAPWEHTCVLDVIDAAQAAQRRKPEPTYLVTDGFHRVLVEAPDAAVALDRAWTATDFELEPEVRLVEGLELRAELDAETPRLGQSEAFDTGGLEDEPVEAPSEENRDLLGDEAIAEVLGISAEWVRQITLRALGKVAAQMGGWAPAGRGGGKLEGKRRLKVIG